MQETEEMLVQSLGREDPRRRAWQPTLVFLSGESPWIEEPGELYSLRGCTELDMTQAI